MSGVVAAFIDIEAQDGIAFVPMRTGAKGADGLVRTALFIKQSQTEKLQKLSEVTGAPVAELIRRAVDDYLEKRKAEIREK
jgi:hypothetical protein